jgi:hypothetical protein
LLERVTWSRGAKTPRRSICADSLTQSYPLASMHFKAMQFGRYVPRGAGRARGKWLSAGEQSNYYWLGRGFETTAADAVMPHLPPPERGLACRFGRQYHIRIVVNFGGSGAKGGSRLSKNLESASPSVSV